MIWTAIIIIVMIELGMILYIATNTENIMKLNNRIDGLHERIDALRDFIMQKIENDYQQLKKNLCK